MSRGACAVCGNPAVARSLCNNHYQRQWRRGLAPLGPRPAYGQYNKRAVYDNGDGTATVPLTKGYRAVIDVDDMPRVSGYTWHACTSKKSVYAATRFRDTAQTFVYLHRLVANVPDGMEADHIDRDTMNNRKSNLRVCGSSLNGMNKGKVNGNTTSLYKGVSFDRTRNKWRASFQYEGVRIERRFSTEAEAARFYNDLAVRRLGSDVTYLNKIPTDA